MIAVERMSKHDIARVRRRVAGRGIRQCRNRQILIVWRGADAQNRVHDESNAIIESDNRVLPQPPAVSREDLAGYRALFAARGASSVQPSM